MYRLTELPALVPMDVCIPTNDLLLSPLGPVINTMTGAFGGVLLPLAILAFVILFVVFIVTILSKKASNFLKGMAVIAGAVILAPLAILIVTALYSIMNNAC